MQHWSYELYAVPARMAGGGGLGWFREDSTLYIIGKLSFIIIQPGARALPLHLLLACVYGALELPRDEICVAYLLPSWRRVIVAVVG